MVFGIISAYGKSSSDYTFIFVLLTRYHVLGTGTMYIFLSGGKMCTQITDPGLQTQMYAALFLR